MSDLSYVRNNDGTYSKLVQLSGSNVKTTAVNALAITSISAFYSSVLDFSDCSEVMLEIFMGLDQSVSIGIEFDGMLINNNTGYQTVTIPVMSGGSTKSRWITKADFAPLGYAFDDRNVRLRLTCGVAPTTGSVTINVIKKKR